MAGTRMKYVMLLVRDVSESISFYGPSGLGLRVVSATQNWAELSMGPGPRLAIKAVDGYWRWLLPGVALAARCLR